MAFQQEQFTWQQSQADIENEQRIRELEEKQFQFRNLSAAEEQELEFRRQQLAQSQQQWEAEMGMAQEQFAYQKSQDEIENDIYIKGKLVDLVRLTEEIAKKSNWYKWFNDEENTKYMQKQG